MRHHYKGRKLGTNPSHTKAMKRSLTAALLYNDRIKTIESRAKEIRSETDRIITWAKKGDVHSRRLAIARLGGDKELVREVFEKVAQGMFADRQGGYTRIMKLGPRKGDGAPMVIIELCTEPVSKKGAAAKKAKKAAPKKVEEKAEETVEAAETTEETDVEAASGDVAAETEAAATEEVETTEAEAAAEAESSEAAEPEAAAAEPEAAAAEPEAQADEPETAAAEEESSK